MSTVVNLPKSHQAVSSSFFGSTLFRPLASFNPYGLIGQRATGRAGKGRKKIRLAMWSHEFICLADCNVTKVPTPMDKAELIRAGLGPRKLSFFEFCENWEFHDEIIAAFPKLRSGGGYELLRSSVGNTKDLEVVPPPQGGYTASFLKSVVGQAKIFIRPMEQCLSLSHLWNRRNPL